MTPRGGALAWGTRLVGVLLLSLMGCTATEPVADPPSKDEQFLSAVEDIGGEMSDEELISAAQDACFELELHVETRREFRLFWKVFLAREVVPPADAPLLLAAAMKTYCPSMARLRPDQGLPA